MDLRELQKAYLDNLLKVTEEKLEIGSLIRTIISIDEGLVFKDGRNQKPKKLVIIGVDKVKKVCYGSVLVNTKMSPKSAYSASFLSAQYLLHQTDYPEFLKYDSYVDCGMLFSIPLEKLMEGEYFGTLIDSDLQGIFEYVWGFSFSKVDQPYIRKIISSNDNPQEIQWYVSICLSL